MLRILIVCLAIGVFASAAESERTPLEVVEWDTIMVDDQTLIGQIVREPDGGGTYEFIQRGSKDARSYPASKVRLVPPRMQTATTAVVRRGTEALKANDIPDAERTVQWGASRAPDKAIALALKILERQPGNTTVAEIIVPLYQARGDAAAIEALCAKVMAVDARWIEGYVQLTAIYQAANRLDELRSMVTKWLNVSPSDARALRYLAALAETDGNRAAAQKAYGSLFRVHKDLVAGERFAILALKRGERLDAQNAAITLIDATASVGTAKGIIGICRAMDGAIEQASPLLAEALADPGTNADIALYVRYAQALITARNGDPAAAISALSAIDHPVAAFSRAMLERNPYPNVDGLPEGLRPAALMLNVAIAVQNRDYKTAQHIAAKFRDADGRLLQQATTMLADPSPENMHRLEATTGEVSVRLQAYGHILAGRIDQAEILLGKLRADDGYAAVYRVYVAAAKKNLDGAKVLFAKVAEANNPPAPAAYVARLAADYEALEQLVESFEWPVGQIATGWQIETLGTGLSATSSGGELRFKGQQINERASWAWRLIASDRLRTVECIPAETGTGLIALAITSEDRQEGSAVAIVDRSLQAAPITKGRIGTWKKVMEASERRIVVGLVGGRVAVIDITNPKITVPLEGAIIAGRMAIGVVVTAAPKSAVDVGVEEMRINLKPAR